MRTLRSVLRTTSSLAICTAVATGLVGTAPADAAGRATATEMVNVRSGAATSYRVLGQLADGQSVTTTSTSGGWTKVAFQGSSGYVSSQYLTSAAASTAGSYAAGSVRLTTSRLNLRRGAGTSFGVLKVLSSGSKVTMTGKVASGFAQVVSGGTRGWVSTRYLSGVRNLLPSVVGHRVATATLNLRTSSGSSSRTAGEVSKGTRLSITGVTQNGRAQIVYRSAVRWVTAKYLATSTPVAGGGGSYAVERGLKPNAIKVHRAAMVKFPQITTYYGLRSGSDSDHSSGRALDLMVPNYTSAKGKALGQAVANWARANARTLGIHYVIWNQRIWNTQRDREGWRAMAGRGSDSANHKNHVHISVNG